jgi:regulator of replication initiation timing
MQKMNANKPYSEVDIQFLRNSQRALALENGNLVAENKKLRVELKDLKERLSKITELAKVD